MKTVPLGIAGLALLASGLLVCNSAFAQDGSPTPTPTPTATPSPTPPPINSRALSATIDYGNGNVFTPAKNGVDFDLLGLDPEQTVTITVQFPVDQVGQAIIADPLDGGLLTLPPSGLIVGSDGTVQFQYQASDNVGSCRLAVHQPDDQNILHFWIVDPSNPQNNPSPLPGSY